MFWLIMGIQAILWLIFFLYQFHLLFIKPYNYWKERNMPYYVSRNPYTEFFYGIQQKVVIARDVLNAYDAFPDISVYGTFNLRQPQLTVKDPEMLRNILVKDFEYFANHGDTFYKDDFLFGNSLFALKDKKWRDMRNILSPLFTGSKLRALVSMVNSCGQRTVAYWCKNISNQTSDQKENVWLGVNFVDDCTKFSNDVIASVAFGLEVNTLEEPENNFFIAGRELNRFPVWRLLIIGMFPLINKIFKLRFAPRKYYNYFVSIVKNVIEARQKAGFLRNDLMHMLLEARQEQMKQVKQCTDRNEDVTSLNTTLLSDEVITAQAFIFFLAGYLNVSVTISFAVYELALDRNKQRKLQKEIDKVLGENGYQVDYEAIKKMKYLHMVLLETLRKYPPVAFIDRECNKLYELRTQNDEIIKIQPGTTVSVPVVGLHHDSKYFPHPAEFDPERFSDENKQKIIPYTYLPFGSGPRVCIATNFVYLEIKIFLIQLFSQLDVSVTKETPIPMDLAGGSTLRPKSNMALQVSKRQFPTEDNNLCA